MLAMDNAYALVIGIADYQYIRKLPSIVLKDAKDIYDLLIDSHCCGYQPDHVKLLLNGQASRTAILQALDDLAQRSNEESTIFFYISSHGGRIESGPYAGEYLLPVDAIYPTDESSIQTAISGSLFIKSLQAISARKVVVIFDCCHAGGIGEPKDENIPILKTGLPESYYDGLQAGKGRVIFSSSLNTELSWILPDAQNSLFTQHLLTGLRGGIVSADGLIRVFDLFEYIQPRVTTAQPNQHPFFKAQLQENFPIAIYLGGKKGVVPYVEQTFLYDAYVSFVDQETDRKWVRETLLPRLRDAGLRVAISKDVEEPGVSRLVSRERGMTQAKRIVLVLSKAYMANNWTNIESIMMQDRGIRRGEYPLVPVQIEPMDDNELPERLAMLSSLDFTDVTEYDREFQRLVKALKGSLPQM